MNIWVPKAKILEARDPIRTQARLAGYFKLKAVRPDGSTRLLADWFPNLVLNQGLNRIGGNSDFLSACRVGTGNTTPTNGDTNLVAHVGGTVGQVSQVTAVSGPPYYCYNRRTFRFAQGVATGNLAEIGVGWATNDASNLFSRALILDGSGDPTTITVLSDESLDATYELRVYSPVDDVVDTVTIGGVDYEVTTRAASANSTQWAPPASGGLIKATVYAGTIGAITGTPGGSQLSTFSVVNDSYSNDSFERTGTATFGLTEGNVTGGEINSISATFGMALMQFGLDAPIDKDGTKILTLNFTHTWARKTL